MSHYPLPKKQVNRERFIIDCCKDKKVLHLGCADWPYTEERIQDGSWLHEKISNVIKNCIGIDLSEETILTLKNKYNVTNIIKGNVENLEILNLEKFDVVIAGEIIEHLNNPGQFMQSVKSVLKTNGKLVITTTNAYCFRRAIRIPFGKESIHPDHVYYFSHRTLEALASRFNFKLIESYSYRLFNRSPLIPYIVERLSTLISPNLGEGIVHVYTNKS